MSSQEVDQFDSGVVKGAMKLLVEADKKKRGLKRKQEWDEMLMPPPPPPPRQPSPLIHQQSPPPDPKILPPTPAQELRDEMKPVQKLGKIYFYFFFLTFCFARYYI